MSRTLPDFELLLGCLRRETADGAVFYRESLIRPGSFFRDGLLAFPDDPARVCRYARTPVCEDAEQVLFIDTETTGLAGGAGTLSIMTGIGRFVKDGFLLRQYVLRDPGEEGAMIAALLQELEDAQWTVTYNGKSFDIPLLNTRLIMHRSLPVFERFHHIDLLPLSRRLWKNTLQSCQLTAVEYFVLGFLREDSDVPGWMIPGMWQKYIEDGDPSFFEDVLYHNRMDILTLAGLFNQQSRILNDPDSAASDHYHDATALGRLLLLLDEAELAERILERELYNPLAMWELGKHYRKTGRWDDACRVWEIAGRLNHVESLVSLSKVAEHYNRDCNLALQLATSALQESQKKRDRRRIRDLEHRIGRLRGKLGLDSPAES